MSSPVETTTNDLGGNADARTIENIPVNGRDYTKLIFLSGVAGFARPDHGFAGVVRDLFDEWTRGRSKIVAGRTKNAR